MTTPKELEGVEGLAERIKSVVTEAETESLRRASIPYLVVLLREALAALSQPQGEVLVYLCDTCGSRSFTPPNTRAGWKIAVTGGCECGIAYIDPPESIDSGSTFRCEKGHPIVFDVSSPEARAAFYTRAGGDTDRQHSGVDCPDPDAHGPRDSDDDKARLDWLENQPEEWSFPAKAGDGTWYIYNEETTIDVENQPSIRAAIDAARNREEGG